MLAWDTRDRPTAVEALAHDCWPKMGERVLSSSPSPEGRPRKRLKLEEDGKPLEEEADELEETEVITPWSRRSDKESNNGSAAS